MKRFQGVYNELITPIYERHELNEDVLLQIVEFNIGDCVYVFWVAGGSG